MKKIIFLLISSISIIACNSKQNLSKESKYTLKDGEKTAELVFDRVEPEMFENFIFKSNNNAEKSFLLAYNSYDRWDEIAKKLIKGKTYSIIFKYFSNQKYVDSLKQNNIMTDDIPQTGNYIYYMEDSKGNVVFKNDSFEVKTGNKNNEVSNSKIDKKYLKYLNDYYPSGMGSSGENVEIKRIAEKTYWVTYIHGAGSSQEIYWALDGNSLVPKFEFEYGGMNWGSEISYTFKNIKNNASSSGTVYGVDSENQILLLKENFCRKG
jgi:hypothetical protein